MIRDELGHSDVDAADVDGEIQTIARAGIVGIAGEGGEGQEGNVHKRSSCGRDSWDVRARSQTPFSEPFGPRREPESLHNTSEVLFRLCANTDLQRDSIFTKGPSDVLDHATSEIASGSKLGIDATKKIPGEGFKRPWPPLIKMDAAVKAKVERLFRGVA